MENGGKARDIACIIGMVVAWAAYYIVSNYMVGVTGSAFVTGLVLRAAAFVFLTLYVIAKGSFKLLFKQGKVTILLFVIGVLGFMLDTFANVGFQHGTVSTGTVLLKTDILMANIATAVILKERLHISDWIATFIMFIGVILVLDIDYGSFSFNWYDLFFIASALSVTVNAFVIKGVQDKYKVKSEIVGYYNNFVVMLLFLISAFISRDVWVLGEITFDWRLILIIAAGGLAQSLIYVFYYRNLRFHPVWQVKLYLLFVPIISCIFGAVVFDEKFNWMKGLGIALVLAGAVIIVIRDKINKPKAVADGGEEKENETDNQKQ